MSNKQKLLGNLSYGHTFVVSAPAGTGKTTLVGMLVREFDCVKMSISSTTRAPRKHEVDGLHYHFLTEAEFNEGIAKGQFLEHVTLFGYQYGTSLQEIEEIKKRGNHVVLVIDTQGALQLKGKIPAIFIFLTPPSLEELRDRLVKRGTDTSIQIEERLSWARKELSLIKEYDYHIVNANLQTAYEVLRSIIIAEEHKIR